MEDRLEHLAASQASTERTTDIEAAFAADGELLALRLEVVEDVGAYVGAPEPATLYRMHGALSGAYRVRNVAVRNRVVLTNRAPTTLNRGFGGPQHYLPIEGAMAIAARRLGLDPTELARRNLVRAEDHPYETPSGGVYASGDYEGCLDAALDLAGYDSWRERRAAARRARPRPPEVGQRRGGDDRRRPAGRRDRRGGHHAPGPGPRHRGRADRGRHARPRARQRHRAHGRRHPDERVDRRVGQLLVALLGGRGRRGAARRRADRRQGPPHRRPAARLRPRRRRAARRRRLRAPRPRGAGVLAADRRRGALGPVRPARRRRAGAGRHGVLRHARAAGARRRRPAAALGRERLRRRPRAGGGRPRHRAPRRPRLRVRPRRRAAAAPGDGHGPGPRRVRPRRRRGPAGAGGVRRRRRAAHPDVQGVPLPHAVGPAAPPDRAPRDAVAGHAARRQGAGRGDDDERAVRAAQRRAGRPRRRRAAGAAAVPRPAVGAAAVKPARFAYARPESVDEALDLLAAHGPGARPLAGGQSLVPWLNMRRIRVDALVDITRLHGLDAATIADGELRVGALVTQTALEAAATPLPVVAECLPFTGHLATRNRGTVGGSIAHADPKGELPLALLAAGGSAVVASSRRGQRTVTADALFTGPFETALPPDELVLETRWPVPGPGEGEAFEELAQRQGDFTLAAAACRIRLGDGHVAAARVPARAGAH